MQHKVLFALGMLLVLGFATMVSIRVMSKIPDAPPNEKSQQSEQSPEQNDEELQAQPSEQPEAKPAEETVVEITATSFAPKEVTAKVGSRLAWVNKDSTPHSITIDNQSNVDESIETEAIQSGASDEVTLSTQGTFYYHCGIHQEVQGVIKVTE